MRVPVANPAERTTPMAVTVEVPATPPARVPAMPATDHPMPTQTTPPAAVTVSTTPTPMIAMGFLDQIILAFDAGSIGDAGGLACNTAEPEGADRNDGSCDD